MHRTGFGGDIATFPRQFGQFLVSSLFLVENLLEQIAGVLIAQLLCPLAETATGSDLVMFDLLGRADQSRVDRRRAFVLGGDLVAFGQQAVDSLALLSPWRFAEGLEDLLNLADVAFGLSEV